jgi:hypothetical protein
VASLLSRWLHRANETSPISMTNWARMYRPGQNVVYNGVAHTAWQTGGGSANGGIVESNSVVFAVESRRLNVFAEARFQFQQMRDGRPGDLFGTAALGVLEAPWAGATTRDLLVAAELDVATSGNSYWAEDPDDDAYLLRLDPACVKILTEAAIDPVTGLRVAERLVGYAHVTDGDRRRVTIYAPDEIAHFKPIPHPSNPQFLGMSWLNPCLPDVDADRMMTQHRATSLRTGGQLGYVVSLDASISPDEFDDFVEAFRADHEGPENSGKTLFLGGGADVKTVGQTFADLALKAEQGAGETRIAACGGVHPVVAGLSEGMQGSSLNAGNYDSAKRSFGDITMRPAWGAFAGAFASLIPPPPGSRLWYDDRDIPFLRQDITAQADVLAKEATTVRQLIDAGYDPDAVIAAVRAGDLGRLLGEHSGWYSVQLQQPGAAEAISPERQALPVRRRRYVRGEIEPPGAGRAETDPEGKSA